MVEYLGAPPLLIWVDILLPLLSTAVPTIPY